MQTNRKFKRYLVAAVLLVLSAYMTIFIKDTVDSLNPEKSLPIASISVGYTMPYVVRAGYNWNFGMKTVRSPFVPASDTPLIVYDCDPLTPITINFSSPCEKLSVYQTKGLYSEDFEELVVTVQTPKEEGVYVYKVDAQFSKGNIVYYFALNVTSQAHNI